MKKGDLSKFVDGGHYRQHRAYISFVAFISHKDYSSPLGRVSMTTVAYPHRQLPPTAQDAALARLSGQRLSRYAGLNRSLSLRVMDAEQEQPLELPASAVALLMDILEAMAAGRGISLIPDNAELTTVEAADVLNVSRPYLIKLLTEGALPHRKVGKHRRIRMEDVMAYKSLIDREREAVLDRLAADAQENDMGYARP
jgi:excisionase family DNA binding protein